MSDSWQTDSLEVINGITLLLEAELITKEIAKDLLIKYKIYDLVETDLNAE